MCESLPLKINLLTPLLCSPLHCQSLSLISISPEDKNSETSLEKQLVTCAKQMHKSEIIICKAKKQFETKCTMQYTKFNRKLSTDCGYLCHVSWDIYHICSK